MLSRDQLNEGDLPESILINFDDREISNKMSFLDKVGDSIRIKAHSVTFEGIYSESKFQILNFQIFKYYFDS
jgi:hypothetical protein